MKCFLSGLAAVLLLLGGVAGAKAGPLSNGSLMVQVRQDNGAIDSVLFGGTDFFNPGTPVSDWGLQVGSDASSFVYNDTSGHTGQSVTVSPEQVATGTYTRGGANVAFSRSYELVPGQNVLRVATTFVNKGPSVTLGYFDTFDPDQGFNLGLSHNTLNDVGSAGGVKFGQSSLYTGGKGHSVVVGSLDARATVASGGPFQINSGSALNDFFRSPRDGNGSIADQGLHIGLRTALAQGQSTTFVYDMAFGLTPGEARSAFAAANAIADPVSPVPEPSTMTLCGLGALGLAACARRQRRRAAARAGC